MLLGFLTYWFIKISLNYYSCDLPWMFASILCNTEQYWQNSPISSWRIEEFHYFLFNLGDFLSPFQEVHEKNLYFYIFHLTLFLSIYLCFSSFMTIFETDLVSIILILEISVLHKSFLKLNFQAKGIISRVPCTPVFLRSRTSGFQYWIF